ncbi:MAG: helix-hairpin-helix domain-containing protein [Leptospirales bacterium]|nr:helix-hairpin-helix domain-containing protein [Leptospirales bacterium]
MKRAVLKTGFLVACLFSFMGAFEYRPAAPVELFPYSLAVKDETSLGQYIPAHYAPLVSGAAISSSASRPYSIEGLSARHVSGVVPLKPFGLSAAWKSFGIPGYMENTFTASAGLAPFKAVSLGIGANYYSLKIHGGDIDTDKNFFDFSASLLIRPVGWFEAAVFAENIRASLGGADEFYIRENYSAGIKLKPFQGLSLIYNVGKDYSGYLNSLSVTAHILPFLSVSCGYARETMTWSGALSAVFKKISVSYGIRLHPYLGVTHIVGLSLNANGENFPSIRYSQGREDSGEKEDVKKIDINTCSNEEIEAIPAINPTHSERIIRYREQIGPVSEKALAQLGLNAREIVALQRYVFGLAQDKQESRGKVSLPKKPPPVKKSKNLFMSLVEEVGLSPTQAMELCEAANKGGREGFRKKLQSMPLGAAEKKEAEAVCARYW